MRRATGAWDAKARRLAISIHALREEGDQQGRQSLLFHSNFYPRPPRGGRRAVLAERLNHGCISIHALREEGDQSCTLNLPCHKNFYPRPPRGGRQARKSRTVRSILFLSTPSARRATRQIEHDRKKAQFLSTPSVRRATSPSFCRSSARQEFLSTPSVRRATGTSKGIQDCKRISIHALREEGDSGDPVAFLAIHRFLSTPSARRATATRTGAVQSGRYFYPRPPRGGRLFSFLCGGSGLRISIHALREEGDVVVQRLGLPIHNFYPRPPRGGRPHTAVG